MSLTRAFHTAQKKNPTWGYRELAEFLGCDIHTLRGINSRLKLPVPVRPKANKGESKRLRGIREAYAAKSPRYKVTIIKHPQARIMIPHQMGSGRKPYGGYLKLC